MSRRLERALALSIVFLVGLGVATYVGDYAILRYRVQTNKDPFDRVTVSVYFATPLKDGKMEYDFQPPQDQRCVNALYPHMGMQPCWYLSRHREQRVNTM